MRAFRRICTVLTCTASCLLFAGCLHRVQQDPIPTSGTVSLELTPNTTTPTDTDTDSQTLQNAPRRVSFAAVGDNVIHPGIYIDAAERAAAAGQGREYDFRPMYENIRAQISQADLAFINQETLMAGASFGYSGYPTFNSPQQLGYDLCEIGFDVVSIANNHMADKGAAGLEATITFWKSLSEQITMIGGYMNQADYDTPRVIEKNGIKIAFLAYTYGSNGLSIYNTQAILPYLSEETVRRQVTTAKEVADVVIVSAHWGDDNGQPINEKQRSFSQLFADLGVDVILGHHPHLIQPIAWLNGSDGHRTLCFYSLGNLLSEMDAAKNMVGGIASFDIVLQGQHVQIENVLFTPTVFFFNARYRDTKLYYMEDCTETLLQKHWCAVSAKGRFTPYGSFTEPVTLAKLTDYTKQIIPAAFLPQSLQQAS